MITGVAGIQRDLHAIEPQAIDGTLYVFESWSQGGEALQTIVTPEVDTEYIATFSAILGLEDFKSAAVYPTPARSEVFVPWMAGENVPEIQLRDMAGRNNTVPVSRASNELILDVRSLSPGLYILSCVGSGRKLTAKVAIAR